MAAASSLWTLLEDMVALALLMALLYAMLRSQQ
jgi:competence protein ComGF